MSEKKLDSSINDYIETKTSKNNVKQQEWKMAIRLQEVSNLKLSKYLKKLLQEKCNRWKNNSWSWTWIKTMLCRKR